MSEINLQRRIIKTLWPVHAIPVENPKQPGTPDIAFIGGWIECKHLDRWPVKHDTIVKIPSLTGKQRVWLLKHTTLKGKAYLWLQVGKEFLIFNGQYAGLHLGKSTQFQMKLNAIYNSTSFPSLEKLIQIGIICH